MEEDQINLLEEHLPYEHDMLDAAYEILTANAHTSAPQDWFSRNAAINEFWLHARNLIEFYCNPSGTSASASDFTTEPLRPEFRFKKNAAAVTNAGEDFSTLINEQICHLKYERVTSPDEKLGGYDLQRVKESIDRALNKFQGLLTDEARRVWKERKKQTISISGAVEPSTSFGSTTTSLQLEASWGPTGPQKP